MHTSILDNTEFSFNDYKLGVERSVRASWELQILRFHTVNKELNLSLVNEINRINKSLDIEVMDIDLSGLNDCYIKSNVLKKAIEQSEEPKWIWFYGIHALKDCQFAGWLRSLLTVRSIENVRVVFVAESKEDLSEVFRDIKKPFYHSTIALDSTFKY
ncbi:hypothetical protein ACU5EH_15070 [Aliivibrio salmonicida]|uniref:hypothetical protein n=1 Tax=Aliivibrio salmonicida TaxID=40269 RepID=UPI00406C7DB6